MAFTPPSLPMVMRTGGSGWVKRGWGCEGAVGGLTSDWQFKGKSSNGELTYAKTKIVLSKNRVKHIRKTTQSKGVPGVEM